MALGRRRARRVLVRMRSMTPRVLRRLLLVGGLALAGWLLSGAGQAHASAGDGRDPGAAAAIGSLPYTGAPAKALAHGHTGRLTAISGRPRGITRDGITRDGIARGVIGTAVRSGGFIRRASGLDPVAATLPTGRVGTGAGWTPRHRIGAVPGGPAAAIRHGLPHKSTAGRGVASPTASVAATGTGTGRGGRGHVRTAPAIPAPPTGFPRGAAGETGALPSSAGSASADGLAGHAARPEVAPRPSSLLTSVLGAVPPAVHTATDEPAVSPD